MEMNHTLIVTFIMLSMGILGGTINYLFSGDEKWSWVVLLKSSVIGIGAAILVPLFLRMISSNLISKAAENTESYFVLMGFCLISAISSRAFIDSMTKKVMRELSEKTEKIRQDVEQVQSEVAPVIEKSTDSGGFEQEDITNEFEYILDSEDLRVLKAFDESPYALRTVKGIIQQTKPHLNNQETVSLFIQRLKESGLVGEVSNVPSKSPKPRYFLTHMGRVALRQSEFNKQNQPDA